MLFFVTTVSPTVILGIVKVITSFRFNYNIYRSKKTTLLHKKKAGGYFRPLILFYGYFYVVIISVRIEYRIAYRFSR